MSFILDDTCNDIRNNMDTCFVSYTCSGHYIYGITQVHRFWGAHMLAVLCEDSCEHLQVLTCKRDIECCL